jgi:hypothetical protein
VPSELGDDMQVNPDSGGRVMTNLEILQHPLSKWGHRKNSGAAAIKWDRSGARTASDASPVFTVNPDQPQSAASQVARAGVDIVVE